MVEVKIVNLLQSFKHSYNDLVVAWDEADAEMAELLSKDYPFQQSFNEIQVDQWVETCIENLKRFRSEEA